MAMKTCSICKEQKNLMGFNKESRSKDGHRSQCRICQNNNNKKYIDLDRFSKYYQDNKEDIKSRVFFRDYKITLSQYDAMFEQQNGLCAICSLPEKVINKNGSVKRLAVDHDHKCCPGVKSCGKCIRKLLCQCCNQAIGLLRDDVDTIISAAMYIAEYSDIIRKEESYL